jgi:hypothetical protein
MSSSVDDYAWFRDHWLYEMYCMTLVRGVTPAEFLSRVGAEPSDEAQGFRAFAQADGEFQAGQEAYGDNMFIGATPVNGHDGPWTLAVEINGIVGTDRRLMSRASAGTRAVSHYRNVRALTIFQWWEDGDLRTTFEWPRVRSGSTPDALVEAMARVGFDLDRGIDVPAKVALAEELTGVRVTAELLEHASYSTGVVKMPPPVEPTPDASLARRRSLGRGLGVLVPAPVEGESSIAKAIIHLPAPEGHPTC